MDSIILTADEAQKFIKLLSGKKYRDTRAALAATVEDYELQTLLAVDPESFVRRRLAENEYADPEVLLTLARNSRQITILEQVAGNRNTPAEALDILIQNPHPHNLTIHYIARHKNTSGKHLLSLLNNVPPQHSDRRTIFANPNFPIEEYRDKIDFNNSHQIEGLASNVNLPEDLAYKITAEAEDRYGISHALSANTSVSSELLQYLLEKRPIQDVAMGIISHPNATEEHIRIIIKKADHRLRDDISRMMNYLPNVPFRDLLLTIKN